MSNKNQKKRLLIDFDRVIHKYSQGWMDGSIYDVPVTGSVEAIRRLQAEGYEVVVFTTKSSLGAKRHREIREWLKKQGLRGLKVTSTKLPALAIIDDRAIRFEGNWRTILNYFL